MINGKKVAARLEVEMRPPGFEPGIFGFLPGSRSGRPTS